MADADINVKGSGIIIRLLGRYRIYTKYLICCSLHNCTLVAAFINALVDSCTYFFLKCTLIYCKELSCQYGTAVKVAKPLHSGTLQGGGYG